MEDYRNREWTVPAHEVEAREREEKKQLMKEAIKEALAETGISPNSNHLGRHTSSYEELVKRLGIR
jgi:hypothetical protein